MEGFFYRDSEDAYKGAWTVLQERYGNPFIVQKAFRDKLMRWPKISANDPLVLREFVDFLQGCTEAIPHIKGLAILNDCEGKPQVAQKTTRVDCVEVEPVAGLLLHTPPKWLSLGSSDTGHG